VLADDVGTVHFLPVGESEHHLEVEAKYRVSDPAAVLAALAAEQVALSDAISQDDQAYAPAGWSYGMSKIGVPFARLRTQGGRHLFTVKKPVDNALACLEHESEVGDRAQMHAALVTMGWVPTVQIVKQRRTGVWGDTALCLDQVDGLGVFVELERMVSSAESGEQVQAHLDVMIRSLGVPVERTTETYDSLIRALTVTA
jgi:adenylate cyclase class 2